MKNQGCVPKIFATSGNGKHANTPLVYALRPPKKVSRGPKNRISCGLCRNKLQYQYLARYLRYVFSDKSTVLHESAKKVPVQFFESAIFGSS